MAHRSGMALDSTRGPAKLNGAAVVEDQPRAVDLMILSDGFHVSLWIPTAEGGVEVGLGEREWFLNQPWSWVKALSSLLHNEGLVVVEQHSKGSVKKEKKVWRFRVSEWTYGEIIEGLESELSFESVVLEGEKIKVIEDLKGYHLFRTCQQFVLRPLELPGKGLFRTLPRPTPLLEWQLDRVPDLQP